MPNLFLRTMHAFGCLHQNCNQCRLLSAVIHLLHVQRASLGIRQALLLEERRLEAHIQATLEQEERAQAARDPLRHAWPEAAPP